MIQRRNSDLHIEERFTRESNRLAEKDLGRIAKAYRELLQGIGEDVDREGLRRTPDRAARALEFLTQGYRQDLDEIINDAVFESEASEIILVKDIELYSMCEHHLLPFIGRAHVAYIPNGKVIGLSKVARIVDVFARRLQIQENLTTQIAESLMRCLEPSGVAVVVEAKHLCMMMRGVEKQNSVMKTSFLLGTFKEDARTRSEFLALLKATADAASADDQFASQARLLAGLARNARHRAPAIALHVTAQTFRTVRSTSAYQQYWTGIVRARDVLGR